MAESIFGEDPRQEAMEYCQHCEQNVDFSSWTDNFLGLILECLYFGYNLKIFDIYPIEYPKAEDIDVLALTRVKRNAPNHHLQMSLYSSCSELQCILIICEAITVSDTFNVNFWIQQHVNFNS